MLSPDDKAPPKGALEQMARCLDDMIAMSRKHIAIHRERLASEPERNRGTERDAFLAELDAYARATEQTAAARAALEPRLAKRRENQAKPRARCNSGRGYQEGEREVDIPKRERGGKS